MEELMAYVKSGARDTKALYMLIERHRQVLKEFDKIPFVYTPLHEAAASGNTTLAIAIISPMPSFGKKINLDGLSPLHVAVIARHKETALALVEFDKQLIRVKGKCGFTPLHYAAAQCRDDYEDDLDILATFLMECPDSIKDHRGNTPLHIAAQHDCVHGVELMVKMAKLNKRNSDHKTPLDLALDPNNNNKNRERIVSILQKAGARKGCELPKKESLVEYNTILVCAVLIAAATYRVGSHMGGAMRSSYDHVSGDTSSLSPKMGKMVMSRKDYEHFMPKNTMAFSLSVVTIIIMLHGRPYAILLHVCLIFLAFSYYLYARRSISEFGLVSRLTFFLALSFIAAAFVLKMTYYLGKALLDEVWWLPRCPPKVYTFLTRLRRQCKLILPSEKYY